MPNDDHGFIELTPQLLAEERAHWEAVAESFQPLSNDAGQQAAEWLRSGISSGALPAETHVLRSSTRGILGFVAFEPRTWRMTRDALARVNLRRRPQLEGEDHLSLLIAWIARDASTPPGFGRDLVLGAIKRACVDERCVALFVDPANDRVRELWCETYRFRVVDKSVAGAAGRLWLPVDPTPGWVVQ